MVKPKLVLRLGWGFDNILIIFEEPCTLHVKSVSCHSIQIKILDKDYLSKKIFAVFIVNKYKPFCLYVKSL